MSPSTLRNAFASALLLAACTLPLWSADYKGTMDFGCCGTIFHLNLVRPPKEKGAPKKEIVLQLHQGCPGRLPLEAMVSADRWDVHAELCEPGSKQCETATAAKIHLDSLSENSKHAVGDFSAEFQNSGHQEGKFTVKYHHDGPRYICE